MWAVQNNSTVHVHGMQLPAARMQAFGGVSALEQLDQITENAVRIVDARPGPPVRRPD